METARDALFSTWAATSPPRCVATAVIRFLQAGQQIVIEAWLIEPHT